MKAYKKSGFVSIFTMSLVIGLLSTALVVNAEGGNRRQKINKRHDIVTKTVTAAQADSSVNVEGGNRRQKINKRHDVVTKTVTAEQADSSVDAEGGNRRLNINNHHSDGNNIKRVSHARTGRGGTKTVKFATSTKVTASLKGNHLVKP